MKTNRDEILEELRRLEALGVPKEGRRELCVATLSMRWSMLSDEVADVFRAEKID